MKKIITNIDWLCQKIIDLITPRYVTPNMVTMTRIFLSPLLFYLVYFRKIDIDLYFLEFSRNKTIFIVFLIAAITDFWDGQLARARCLSTDWGKKLETIADKFLILVFIFLLYDFDKFIFTFVFIFQIITVVVSLFAYFEGKNLTVNYFGKVLTFFISVGFCLILLEAEPKFIKTIFYCTFPMSLANIGVLVRHKINYT